MKKTGERKKSSYAMKKSRGNMMYGPGCCAHTITAAQIQAAKEEARKNGHYRGNWLSDS